MKRFTLLAAALAALISSASAQTPIFDNTTSSLNNNMPLLPEWRTDSGEAGDDIWITSPEREVVSLKILLNYRGTLPGTIDARIRFRNLTELEQTPGEAFYDSGMIFSLPTLAGINEYNFVIPHVIVPDHFVWTIQAYNRQGSVGEIGPAYYNPPTVGFSDDFFWLSDEGSEWIAYSWGGDPFANFAARIEAVPEPTTMLALAAGAGLLLRRRKRA
jgi:hypothetical protein